MSKVSKINEAKAPKAPKAKKEKKLPPGPFDGKATEDIRSEVITMAERLRAIKTVPDRILKGSHQDAVNFKDTVEQVFREGTVKNGVAPEVTRSRLIELHTKLSNYIKWVS